MQLHHLPDCFTVKLTFLSGDKVGGKGYFEDFTYFELSVVLIQGIIESGITEEQKEYDWYDIIMIWHDNWYDMIWWYEQLWYFKNPKD